jgi:hypothetical protein
MQAVPSAGVAYAPHAQQACARKAVGSSQVTSHQADIAAHCPRPWQRNPTSSMYSTAVCDFCQLMLGCCDFAAQVTVTNNIPDDWPAVAKGISVHWHGFR